MHIYLYRSFSPQVLHTKPCVGRIAHDFTSTLSVMGCNITAVASSQNNNTTLALPRAKLFANKFSIPTYYASYHQLALDPNVDIVYVATTNQNHMEPTLMMLRAGKNVLVEKPTAVTYEEAKIMYDEAKVSIAYECWCSSIPTRILLVC